MWFWGGEPKEVKRLREIRDSAGDATWRAQHGAEAAEFAVQQLVEGSPGDDQRAAMAACAVGRLALYPHNCIGERPAVIPRLAALLGSASVDVQGNAACAIGNVCAGVQGNREAFGDVDGAMQQLVALLGSASVDVQKWAALAIASVCYGVQGNKEAFCAVGGGMQQLVALLGSASVDVQRNAALAICNVCCGVQGNQEAFCAVGGGMQQLVALLGSASVDVQGNAALAISNVCCGVPSNQEAFGAVDGGMQQLVALLGSASVHVQKWAASAVCNICSGHPSNQEAFGAADGLNKLVALLGSSSATVVEEAAFAIGDACRGHAQNIARLERAGGLPALFKLAGATNQDVAASALITVCQVCDDHDPFRDALRTAAEACPADHPLRAATMVLGVVPATASPALDRLLAGIDSESYRRKELACHLLSSSAVHTGDALGIVTPERVERLVALLDKRWWAPMALGLLLLAVPAVREAVTGDAIGKAVSLVKRADYPAVDQFAALAGLKAAAGASGGAQWHEGATNAALGSFRAAIEAGAPAAPMLRVFAAVDVLDLGAEALQSLGPGRESWHAPTALKGRLGAVQEGEYAVHVCRGLVRAVEASCGGEEQLRQREGEKAALLDTLDAARAAVADGRRARTELARIRSNLARAVLSLSFCGAMNVGKSLAIRVLLGGADVLPVDYREASSHVVRIDAGSPEEEPDARYGEVRLLDAAWELDAAARARLPQWLQDHLEAHPVPTDESMVVRRDKVDELAPLLEVPRDGASGSGTHPLFAAVGEARIVVPLPAEAPVGFQIVDSPGVDGTLVPPEVHARAAAMQKETDLIVCVVKTDSLTKAQVVALLEELRERGRPVVVLVTHRGSILEQCETAAEVDEHEAAIREQFAPYVEDAAKDVIVVDNKLSLTAAGLQRPPQGLSEGQQRLQFKKARSELQVVSMDDVDVDDDIPREELVASLRRASNHGALMDRIAAILLRDKASGRGSVRFDQAVAEAERVLVAELGWVQSELAGLEAARTGAQIDALRAELQCKLLQGATLTREIETLVAEVMDPIKQTVADAVTAGVQKELTSGEHGNGTALQAAVIKRVDGVCQKEAKKAHAALGKVYEDEIKPRLEKIVALHNGCVAEIRDVLKASAAAHIATAVPNTVGPGGEARVGGVEAVPEVDASRWALARNLCRDNLLQIASTQVNPTAALLSGMIAAGPVGWVAWACLGVGVLGQALHVYLKSGEAQAAKYAEQLNEHLAEIATEAGDKTALVVEALAEAIKDGHDRVVKDSRASLEATLRDLAQTATKSETEARNAALEAQAKKLEAMIERLAAHGPGGGTLGLYGPDAVTVLVQRAWRLAGGRAGQAPHLVAMASRSAEEKAARVTEIVNELLAQHGPEEMAVEGSSAATIGASKLQYQAPDHALTRAVVAVGASAAGGLMWASRTAQIDDLELVRKLCGLCEAVYATSEAEFEAAVPAGATVKHFSRSQEAMAQWAVVQLGGHVTAIVFRGTATLADVAIDVAIANFHGLHAGIAAVARRTLVDVVNKAQAALAAGHRVVVTGHSLGGGYAQCSVLLAAELRDNERVSVVTFGAPLVRRTGGNDDKFAAMYEAATGRMRCFVRDFDMVPRLLGTQDAALAQLGTAIGLDGGKVTAIVEHAQSFQPIGAFVFLYFENGKGTQARKAKDTSELTRVLKISVLGGKKLVKHHKTAAYAKALKAL